MAADPQQLLDRAVALHRAGDSAQAEALYRQLLRLQPHPGVHHLLGLLYAQSVRPELALKNFDAALVLQPGHMEALCGRADILCGLQRHAEAVTSYDRVLALQPAFADARTNRGAALLELLRFDEALADFDRVVAMTPRDPDAHYNRGRALAELYRFAEALDSLDAALALKPDHIGALNNRGIALWSLDRWDEALASYDRALACAPHLAGTLTSRANTLTDLKRFDEALACHDRAIALAPDMAAPHWNKSHVLLLTGRWREGFALFEWRKQRPQSPYPDYDRPLWTGQEDIAGKTLFIVGEQGLGDTLQFCRYAALAQARGAHVILGVQKPLLRLLQGLIPSAQICRWTDTPADFDYHIPLMSMPLVCGTTLDSIPAATPYLKPEATLVDRWAQTLGGQGFKIGVSWRGGGRGLQDIGRSYPLRELESLSRLPGVRLISLQRKTGMEERTHLPPGMVVEDLGGDFDGGGEAFIDSAAVMQSLDLIISSDTAIAHLAGALGRPVWLAAKHVPDWRWLLDREDSPWYPSLRIFRQQRPGDWASVFAQMHAELSGTLPLRVV